MLIILTLITLFGYMSAWFVLAYKLKRLDVVDTAWGGGFITVATLALIWRFQALTILLWLLTLVWGLRLARHVWQRNVLKGPDQRYEELSGRWSVRSVRPRAYASIFLLHGAYIAVISLPLSIAAVRPSGLGWIVYWGLAVWLAGFCIETVADRQLSRFQHRSHHKDAVLQTGLWRYSRHPNYFGELVQWWAIGLITLTAPYGWFGLVGPALLTYLIIYVSGIPAVEKRRAANPAYQAYIRRTSPLILRPPYRDRTMPPA